MNIRVQMWEHRTGRENIWSVILHLIHRGMGLATCSIVGWDLWWDSPSTSCTQVVQRRFSSTTVYEKSYVVSTTEIRDRNTVLYILYRIARYELIEYQGPNFQKSKEKHGRDRAHNTSNFNCFNGLIIRFPLLYYSCPWNITETAWILSIQSIAYALSSNYFTISMPRNRV